MNFSDENSSGKRWEKARGIGGGVRGSLDDGEKSRFHLSGKAREALESPSVSHYA